MADDHNPIVGTGPQIWRWRNRHSPELGWGYFHQPMEAMLAHPEHYEIQGPFTAVGEETHRCEYGCERIVPRYTEPIICKHDRRMTVTMSPSEEIRQSVGRP